MTDNRPNGRRPSQHRPTRNPRKSYSQNFFKNARAADYFADHVDIGGDSLVLEVGPGSGLITQRLASRCRKLVAHEIDGRLAERLRKQFRDVDNVRVMHNDFARSDPPNEPFHVVGNIPFAVTTKIINWCLEAPQLVSATLVTQAEYAKKRTGAYGRWSLVTAQSWPLIEWQLHGVIRRNMFYPIPKTDAAVLRLVQRQKPLVTPELMDAYRELVEIGFSGVGGTLYKTLTRRYPTKRVAAAFKEIRASKDTVVAFVHPDDWIVLFHVLMTPKGAAS